jgi:pilus assembly protein CpaB
VVPGMRVDVLISGNKPGGDQSTGIVTRTLLQNLEVMSAGQDFKKDAEGKPILVQVVNLLVTPEQAEQLSLASTNTQLQLVLRNPLDHNVAKTSGTAMSVLFGAKPKTPEEPRAEAPTARPAAPRPRPSQAVRIAAAEAPVVAAPAPPRREPPFVMEIYSGNRRAETKFDNSVGVK